MSIFLPPYDNLKYSGRQWMNEGVQVSNVTVGSSPLSYPQALASLVRSVDSYNPDLIHIFKPKGFAGAAGTYLLLKSKYPIALDCDDWEGWGGWNEGKPYPWIVKEYIDRQEHWMMRAAPVVTVASRALQARVSKVRKNGSDVYYVPNCAAAQGNLAAQQFARSRPQAETRRAFGLSGSLFIFYSGHFERSEDASFFCQSAAEVARQNNASIVFVGEGPFLPIIRQFFVSPARAKAYFFPRLDYSRFVQLISACDVTAFPYPDDGVHRAKCSARILDYMAMEKPVLTSDLGENREYIVDGESGFLTAPGNEREFAEKLDVLLKNPGLRARMGKCAAERVREKFQWKGHPLQQCLAAYRRICTRPSLAQSA